MRKKQIKSRTKVDNSHQNHITQSRGITNFVYIIYNSHGALGFGIFNCKMYFKVQIPSVYSIVLEILMVVEILNPSTLLILLSIHHHYSTLNPCAAFICCLPAFWREKRSEKKFIYQAFSKGPRFVLNHSSRFLHNVKLSRRRFAS